VSSIQTVANILAEGERGSPLVVLAHGLEDSWEGWRPMAARLPADWRVIALDLPWRPGNDYRWRRRAPAAWLADGLELAGEPTTVVAHSFGANAALDLMCAGRIGPAVLICPLYRPPEVALTWAVFDRSRRAFDQHMRDGLLMRMGRRADTLDPEILAKMIATAIDRVGPAGFLAVFEQFCASAGLPLAELAQPALVLAGGADPTLSRPAAAALAAAMPSASVFFRDHYDHFCHRRYAAEVAASVTDFVAASGRPARDQVAAANRPAGDQGVLR
jgi:pimeloyl-ACP methyl ester carboxylesterase